MAQRPNASLVARTKPATGRKLKSPDDVWGKASRILIASKLRLDTHRLLAVQVDRRVLGNTWWTFVGRGLSAGQRKALLLWLNSSLGILTFYGGRNITEGSWVNMKKPSLSSMPVLDVRNLADAAVARLSEGYDALRARELSAVAALDADAARGELDAVLCGALGLPDLGAIRELLAREPGVRGRTRPD